jgi:DNA polymerase-3 subunit gamma/tau
LIQDLESGGRNLQHFCRELCRFFRNLLVVKIAGASSRLIAAAGGERQRLAELAGQFSEEDLTRYLHLAVELFQQMQVSLQPRMHLELGLVRLVHAGRLRSVEEILASLDPGGGAAPKSMPPPVSKPQKSFQAAPAGGDWKGRLVHTLGEKGMTFICDAVEHAEVNARGADLEFVTSKEFAMALRSKDLQKVADTLAGRSVKITVRIGEAAVAAPEAGPEAMPGEEEAARRVLENPEVRRFRELFPGSEVRAVRNLKESQ